MRWVLFAVVLYVTLVLQTAAMPFISVQSVRPDLPAMLMVYVCLAASPSDALIAAWVAGLAVDLNSTGYGQHGNVGISALAYGVAALAIVKVRGYTFRDHALTYFLFCGLATAFIHAVVVAHMIWVCGVTERWTGGLATAVAAAVYSAAVSPYVHWLLRRSRGLLGIGPMRTLRVRSSR